MHAEYFRTIYAFLYWARGLRFELAAQLTVEKYAAPLLLDNGNISATLVNALSGGAPFSQSGRSGRSVADQRGGHPDGRGAAR